MTGTQLATLIRKKTRANSTTYADAEMLVDVNNVKNEIASLIADRNQKFFERRGTFALVANQRHYSLPDDMLNNLTKVEVMFATGGTHYEAKAMKDYRGSETEAEIVNNFSNNEGEFAYVIRNRGIFILSGTIISVTGGYRIWYVEYPADLSVLTGSTDLTIDPTTTSSGFPKQFHELLARKVSIEWKGRNNVRLNELELNYENDLQKQLNAISHFDHSLEIIGSLPSRADLYDDGFSL
ncbi:MAG: hypothetical protein KKB38_21095 [Gammaproteobacteria bacterium]|nr:hypothetical protein [Gammaproteobacteria bacterium]